MEKYFVEACPDRRKAFSMDFVGAGDNGFSAFLRMIGKL
jgi:hypothetical protein